MLLLAEIILTIFAWRGGWKWFSLIPVALSLIIGFFIGMTIPNVDPMSVWWVDALAIIALIIMIVKPRK